jgi:orotate phosphoribosyltransferase
LKLEVRMKGEVVAALDERGNPLLAVVCRVRNYGRGNQVYLPKEWQGKRVVVVDVNQT